MSDQPTNEQLKEQERLKIEIPVEDENNQEGKQAEADLIAEMKNLGRQFAEAIRAAWNSQERQKIEADVREGLDVFVSELEKGFKELRDSEAAKKAKQEVSQVKEKVDAADLGRKTKSTLAEGLRWLSEEFNSLASQFTPADKDAEDKPET